MFVTSEERKLVPLGRFLILLRLLVVASLIASSPAAVLARSVDGGAGLACKVPSKGGLCQRSGQQHESFAAVPLLIFEEITDPIDDAVSAVDGAQPLYGPAPPHDVSWPRLAYLRAAYTDRAHPATGPPSLS
jgi:hypothetical protein